MRKPSKDRELYSGDIQWFLLCSDAALGSRGGLGSLISNLERGGPATVMDPETITDQQLGWCVGEGSVERWRRLFAVWRNLGRESQTVLMAHYMPRSDLPDYQRAGVEGALGSMTNAALWVTGTEALGKLIGACVDKNTEGRAGIIRAARTRADKAVRQAHRSWMAFAEVLREAS